MQTEKFSNQNLAATQAEMEEAHQAKLALIDQMRAGKSVSHEAFMAAVTAEAVAIGDHRRALCAHHGIPEDTPYRVIFKTGPLFRSAA